MIEVRTITTGSTLTAETGSWKRGARQLAEQRGECSVVLGDGRLVVFIRGDDGKIRQKTHRRDAWTLAKDWAWSSAAALCLSLGLFATPASAHFVDDLRYCEEQADARTSTDRNSSAIPNAIGGAANVVGAIIGGYNPGPAVSGAVQSGIHGAENDARAAALRRRALIDRCLMEKENEQRGR